jgi:hypothetical protein
MKISCKQCNKEREVSNAMVRLIERGINSGNCKSCSLKGNTRRYADVYDNKLYDSRLYKIWGNLKTRCNNKKVKSYKDYGERGITYCREWETFNGFFNNLPDGYSNNLTLDRIDNNKGYSKENCRWVDKKTQANNRRTNRIVTINNETKTLQQWINHLNLKTSTVSMRLHYGWSVEKALFNNKL